MKKFILLLMSVAMLFACEKNNSDDNGGGGKTNDPKATVVRLGASTLTFEAYEAESQEVKVYADGTWTSEAPEWVTLEPKSGSGTVTVKVTVTDNESIDGRVGTVVFAPELTSSTTNKLTVQQKGDNKVTLKTGAAFAEWLAGLTSESLDEARIAADLDMTDITLVPAEGFAGVLDGQGYSIKNLVSSKPLFKVNDGTLMNIVIDESCSFEPDTLIFGTIAARNNGIVKDCINKADVTRNIVHTDKFSNLVAGIIGVSSPNEESGIVISGCKNYGKISLVVTDQGSFTTQGVAGIVSYSLTPLSNCENYGDVSLSGGYHARRACPVRDPADPENIEVGEFYNKKVSSALGGVVSWAIGPLDKCKNEGKVTWTESKVEGMTTSPARIFTGGVAGTYYGAVSDCSNSGEILITVVTSTGETFAGQNHQHCMGGVFGAFNNPVDDSPSKNRGGSVSGCTNSGNITVEAMTSRDWAHLGGIVGWPAGENDSTNASLWGVMSNCTNSGNITLKGNGQVRVGGLVGVTPYMENCSNTGKITILGAEDFAEIGGIAGHHWGFAQTIKNCSSKADIESSAIIDVGGFFGWVGNGSKTGQSATVEGGSFSGNITCAAGSEAGMLVGGFAKNDSDKIKATIGTSTAPVEVSGSLNGTPVSTSNAPRILWGVQFDEKVQSFNYVII